jgi:hypothetical protein
MANIVIRLSTGSAASTVGTGGNSSIGGQMALSGSSVSDYQLTTSDNLPNNIWDDMSKTDNFYENSDYRCIYIYVASGSLSDPKLFIHNTPKAKFSFKVANAKNTTAPIIASDITAPVDPNAAASWSSENPNSLAPVSLLPAGQTLNAGDHIYVWIKRKGGAIPGTGVVVDNMGLAISGLE